MREKDQKIEGWGSGEKTEEEGLSSYVCVFYVCLWGGGHAGVKRQDVSGDSEAVTPKDGEERRNRLLYPSWGGRSGP